MFLPPGAIANGNGCGDTIKVFPLSPDRGHDVEPENALDSPPTGEGTLWRPYTTTNTT
jgi:hypothetical protein